MGEDFPLDPNQVQQPQEEEARHIEIAAHEGDTQLGEVALSASHQEPETQEGEQAPESDNDTPPPHEGEEGYVQDTDKARVMAEAGYGLRAMARAKSEQDVPEKLRTLYRTRMSNRANGAEGRGMSAKEMFEQEAERVEERTGEEYEAARSSDYSHDVEKAMRMMRAERARKTNLAEKTPLEAGNQYDLERAEKEVGKPLTEVLEASKESSDKAIAFLRFSHSIAEQYRSVGDDLTPNLEALDMAYKFTAGWGHKTLQEYGHNKWVQVAFDSSEKGAITITKGTEKWRIPIFDDDPNGYKHTGSYARPRDFAYYEVVESTPDPDGEFDKVQVRKLRSLSEADVSNLGKAFAAVKAFDAEKRKNTLYPGDEGYEEELAEINYGRDL